MAEWKFLTARVSAFPFGLKPYCLHQMASTREGFEKFDRCYGYFSNLSRPEAYALKRLLNSCPEYNCTNARVSKSKKGGTWMVSMDYLVEHKEPHGRQFFYHGERMDYPDWRNKIAWCGGLAQWDRFDCQMGDTSEDFEWAGFKAVKF